MLSLPLFHFTTFYIFFLFFNLFGQNFVSGADGWNPIKGSSRLCHKIKSPLNLQLSLTKRWQSWLPTCQEQNIPRKNWRQNCQWISKSTKYSHGCNWSNYGDRGKFSWNWRWPKYLAGKDTRILGQLKSRMPASISGLLYNSLHFSTIQIILLKKILV